MTRMTQIYTDFFIICANPLNLRHPRAKNPNYIIILNGGLRTKISGIGVYYPDGTQTQRIGIVPNVRKINLTGKNKKNATIQIKMYFCTVILIKLNHKKLFVLCL